MIADLGPPEETPMKTVSAVEGSTSASLAYRFFDEGVFCSGSAESSDGEMDRVLNDKFSLRYLAGSGRYVRHCSPPPVASKYLSQNYVRIYHGQIWQDQ